MIQVVIGGWGAVGEKGEKCFGGLHLRLLLVPLLSRTEAALSRLQIPAQTSWILTMHLYVRL